MYATHRVVGEKLLRRFPSETSPAKWSFRAFYFAKILWIVVAGFLAGWLSSSQTLADILQAEQDQGKSVFETGRTR